MCLKAPVKLVVDVSPTDKQRMDALVAAGNFASSEQFIEVAIRNQLSLEGDEAYSAGPQSAGTARGVPDVFKLPSSTESVGLGEPEPVSASLLPHFVTKLHPMKVVCRFVANHLHVSGKKELSIAEVSSALAQHASELRQYLYDAQQGLGRTRGTYLHAGLPEANAPSQLRFLTLYFAGRPGSQPSDSLTARLGLLTVKADGRGGSVGLTEWGDHFAAMPNAVLDGETITAETSAFDEVEAEHLASLFYERGKTDCKLMISLLAQLDDEPLPRDDLKSKLLPAIRKSGGKTEAIAEGVFTAITARLVELEAVTIVKDGLRTGYVRGPRATLVRETLEGSEPWQPSK